MDQQSNWKKTDTMSAPITGNIHREISLSAHEKKAHTFDGLHSASLISLEKLCNDYCVAILKKNEINILKGKTLSLKWKRNKIDVLWRVPAQDVLFALILWYVAKTIFIS